MTLQSKLQKLKKSQKKASNKIADKGLKPEYYQKYGDLSELETASDREDFLFKS